MSELNRMSATIPHLVPEGSVKHTGLLYGHTTVEDIKAIAEDVMRRADAWVEKIIKSPELTWDAVIAPFNEMDDEYRLAYGRALFMANVHRNKTIRDAADDADAKVSQYSNKLWYNGELYTKVKAYSETPEALALEGEQARLLAFTLRDFRRLGHGLGAEERQRLEKLSEKLIKNGIEFERNIREDKTVALLAKEDLVGLPEEFIADLERDDAGNYKLTMNYPHVVPFLSMASNRKARRRVSIAYNTRAVTANRPILEATVKIRQEFASILGYPSWAHYQLEVCTAKTPDTVKDFYADLINPITVKGKEELAVLAEMLHADGYEGPVRTCDWKYYDNKLRERAGVDQEKVAEYFPMDAVLEGLFEITSETFGLQYKRLQNVPTWHEDVRTVAIIDKESGKQIAMFYMDLFPRDGKYNHAAEFSLRPGREMPDGTYRSPLAAMITNFTKPTKEKPSLLKYNEVVVLFHEFGHVLHELLTRARYVKFAGTEVERDYVESLSQILEHWVMEPEILQRFAKHYKTNKPIPTSLIKKIVDAEQIDLAITKLRQISLGYLDLAMHDETPNKDLDKILSDSVGITLVPHESGTFMPASFGHLFGYDARYNGYLRSESIGDDMYYSRFKKEGLTNPVVGLEFRRKIQERGGTEDGPVMSRDFLGRDLNNDAFLKKLGIDT